MSDLVIQLVLVVIGLFILYFIIRAAAGTDKKIDLLSKISDDNDRIATLMEHFISIKAPLKGEDDLNNNWVKAINLAREIKLIAKGRGINHAVNQCYDLALMRKSCIKDAVSKGFDEKQSSSEYDELVSQLHKSLPMNDRKLFAEHYNKGIEA